MHTHTAIARPNTGCIYLARKPDLQACRKRSAHSLCRLARDAACGEFCTHLCAGRTATQIHMQPRYISSVLEERRYKPNVRGNASRFEILRTNGTLSPFALVPTIRAETGRALRHALSLGNAGWAWIGSRGVLHERVMSRVQIDRFPKTSSPS